MLPLALVLLFYVTCRNDDDDDEDDDNNCNKTRRKNIHRYFPAHKTDAQWASRGISISTVCVENSFPGIHEKERNAIYLDKHALI